MSEQNVPDHNQGPDAFARPGQVPPPPASPWGSYPPPAPGATPFFAATGNPYAPYAAPAVTPYPAPTAQLGGATAVGGRRRSPVAGRLVAAVGALAAVAVLAASSGLLTARTTTITTTPATTTQPAASGPAQTMPAQTGPGTSTGGSTGSGTSVSSSQVAATAAQSKGVVLINTTLTNGSAAGTGMVIDSSGLVLTNYHVVQGSTKVEVTVAASNKTYTATVLGHDATNDVALLKLEGASVLDTVAIDNDAVTVGETVSAVGNANGQEYLTSATGQITATSATVTVSNDSATGTETLTDVYETNAQAQPGDSGGPMFDSQTEVTAMTTAGETTYRGPRSGTATTVTSYAIPIARALSVVKQIEAGTSSGTVKVGANAYLGITVATRSTSSAVVSSVTAGTPAADAGITAGSTITAIGGTSVSSQPEIATALAGHSPGDTVKVTWTDSSGSKHSADVTLAASPVN